MVPWYTDYTGQDLTQNLALSGFIHYQNMQQVPEQRAYEQDTTHSN